MTIALVTIGVLAALVGIVAAVGYTLPVAHTARVERTYAAGVEELFRAVAATSEYPSWRRGVKRVEQLPPREGKPSFRELGGNGEITFIVEEMIPNRRIVSRIADVGLPFGGKWTYEFTPVAEGERGPVAAGDASRSADAGARSRLRITEEGEVYNPIFRLMARFVFGHDRTMRQFLDDVDRLVAARVRPPA